MLLIIAKIAKKNLCADCRFITTKKLTHVTVFSFHENGDEENNADDISVIATNDMWDESDSSYPDSDDVHVDSDDGSHADVHIVERTMSPATSYSFAVLVESSRFQIPIPNCLQHLVPDLSGNLWTSDGKNIFLVEKNGR